MTAKVEQRNSVSVYMSEMSCISIAMATYNGARFIREQLDSLAAQILLPSELVVTDDGSTDDTLKIVAEFASTAPFPVHIHKNEKCLGFANNFLYAASLCKGDFIAFCDQDDIWKAEKLACCAATFDSPEVLLCVHSAELIDAGGNRTGQRFPNYKKYKQRANGRAPGFFTFYYGFSMVFRREVFDVLSTARRLFNFNHDSYIGFLSASLGDVVYLPEALAQYRQHESNVSGAPRVIGVSKTIVESSIVGATHYDERAKKASERGALLSEIAVQCQGVIGYNAQCGAAREKRRCITFTRRKERYNTHSPYGGLISIMKAILLGDYGRRTKGGLGGRALIKDFVLLVTPALLTRAKDKGILDTK